MNYTEIFTISNYSEIFIIPNIIIYFIFPLFATLIGAFFGFFLVKIWEEKRKKNELKNSTRNFLNALISEMVQIIESSNNDLHTYNWNSKKKIFEGMYGEVTLSSLTASLNSGTIILASHELQIELSLFDILLRQYRFFLEQTLTFYKIQFNDVYVQNKTGESLSLHLNTLHDTILEKCKEIIVILKSERNKL